MNNKNKKQEKKVYPGACSGCYQQDIQNVVSSNCSEPPEWSIANKHFFGMLPHELSCLNQVDLELCKISRVGGQIFTLYTGSHTSIKVITHYITTSLSSPPKCLIITNNIMTANKRVPMEAIIIMRQLQQMLTMIMIIILLVIAYQHSISRNNPHANVLKKQVPY